MDTKRIDEIHQYGKTARGKSELVKHLKGERLSLRQAVLARCYDCMGFYADGKVDCNIPHCPLHPFMAYNEGRQKQIRKRTMTEAHKEKMQAALRRQAYS